MTSKSSLLKRKLIYLSLVLFANCYSIYHDQYNYQIKSKEKMNPIEVQLKEGIIIEQQLVKDCIKENSLKSLNYNDQFKFQKTTLDFDKRRAGTIEFECKVIELKGFLSITTTFFSFITLGLIPAVIPYKTSVSVRFNSRDNEIIKTFQKEFSRTTINGILFFPAFFVNNIEKNQSVENYLNYIGDEIHQAALENKRNIDTRERDLAEIERLKIQSEKEEERIRIKNAKAINIPIGAIYCNEAYHIDGLALNDYNRDLFVQLQIAELCFKTNKRIQAKLLEHGSWKIRIVINEESFYSTPELLKIK